MTYQEIYKELGWREKICVHLMNLMKTDEEGMWTVCPRNKLIYKITKAILGRYRHEYDDIPSPDVRPCRDGFDITWAVGNMLTIGENNEDEVDLLALHDEIEYLRIMFNN